jgi:exosortase
MLLDPAKGVGDTLLIAASGLAACRHATGEFVNKIGQTPVAANASAIEAVEIFGRGGRDGVGEPLSADAAVPEPKTGSARWGLPDIVFVLGVLGLAIPTLIFVAQSTWTGEQGSHGPIILATGLWLIWHNWHEVTTRIERSPAWKVAVLFAVLTPIYLFTRITQIVELEGYAMYSLLLVALYGVVGFRAMKALAFPLIYLFFAFPPPETVIYTLTLPIKVAISDAAIAVLQLFGLPIGGTGVMIQIGQYQLLVAAACSGLNSIVSLSAITLFYIYLMHRGEHRIQAILLLFVLPVAIAANFLRVLILILLTYYGGEAVAQGFLHDLAGVTIFVLALLLIFLIDKIVVKLGIGGERKAVGGTQHG